MDDNVFTCEICHKTKDIDRLILMDFNTKYFMKNKGDNTEKKYRCNICSRCFGELINKLYPKYPYCGDDNIMWFCDHQIGEEK